MQHRYTVILSGVYDPHRDSDSRLVVLSHRAWIGEDEILDGREVFFPMAPFPNCLLAAPWSQENINCVYDSELESIFIGLARSLFDTASYRGGRDR